MDSYAYRHENQRSRGRGEGERERPNTAYRKVLRIAIVVLSVILVSEIVYHFVLAPRFVIEKVRISADGTLAMADAEILEVAGLREAVMYYRVDPEAVAARLEAYPLIRTAEVVKHFPDTIELRLTGREPLALSLVETSGRNVPVMIDRDGVVFLVGQQIKDFSYPVLSGLQWGSVSLGTTLPAELQPFLGDLDEIRKESPVGFRQISEIRFVRRVSGEWEALLYFARFPVPVRVGSRLPVSTFLHAVSVLDASKDRAREWAEIDFRSSEIVYRLKEGSDAER